MSDAEPEETEDRSSIPREWLAEFEREGPGFVTAAANEARRLKDDMPSQLDEQEIRRRLEPLFTRSDVDLVVLFGSRARGSAVPSSDVDIGVIARGNIEELRIEAICLLQTDWVDVVDLSRAGPLLAMSVARYGRPLHEGKPGAFACFASLALRRYNDTAKFRELEARRLREWIAARGG